MLVVLAIEIRWESWHLFYHAMFYLTNPGKVYVPQAERKHTEKKTAENPFSLATLQDPKRSTPSEELGASREDLPNVLLSCVLSMFCKFSM